MPKTITVTPDPKIEAQKAIVDRQKQRVAQGKTKYSLDDIGSMLSDILENQAERRTSGCRYWRCFHQPGRQQG